MRLIEKRLDKKELKKIGKEFGEYIIND